MLCALAPIESSANPGGSLRAAMGECAVTQADLPSRARRSVVSTIGMLYTLFALRSETNTLPFRAAW